jgi:hypothetical protein
LMFAGMVQPGADQHNKLAALAETARARQAAPSPPPVSSVVSTAAK